MLKQTIPVFFSNKQVMLCVSYDILMTPQVLSSYILKSLTCHMCRKMIPIHEKLHQISLRGSSKCSQNFILLTATATF